MKKQIKMNDAGRLVGESHPRAKLTDAEVDTVLDLLAGGMTRAQVAAKFDVSVHCIAHIACGRRRGQLVSSVRVVSINP